MKLSQGEQAALECIEKSLAATPIIAQMFVYGHSLQPEPHTAASDGHDQEGSKANAVGGHVSSTNRPPQPDEPESAPGDEGEHDQKRGEVTRRRWKGGQPEVFRREWTASGMERC
jgi:hypothetical protein